MAVEVGQEAPDFTLKDGNGEEVTLSSFRGGNVVLVFYPAAFSGVCTKQLTQIGEHESRYGGENAQVVGVSTDNFFTVKAFGESIGLDETILLSDFEPKGAAARSYGVYAGPPFGTSGRATFVIDKDGVVRDATIMDNPLEMPDEETYFTSLASCPV